MASLISKGSPTAVSKDLKGDKGEVGGGKKKPRLRKPKPAPMGGNMTAPQPMMPKTFPVGME